MKKSKCTESQIIKLLKEQESGRSAADICREHGISQSTFITGGRSIMEWMLVS